MAGPLAIDTTVYQNPTWRGSTAYLNVTSGLQGYIDWAVYAPNTFPAGFSFFDENLNPSAVTPNEFVYAYQIYSTGTDPNPPHSPVATSNLNVALENDADNIGYFTGNNGFGAVAGDVPIFIELDPLSQASWFFDGIVGTIAVPGTSMGLAFSSPNIPMFVTGTVFDGGTSDDPFPLPSPDSVGIPEPSTLVLASCGIVVVALRSLRRRGRRSRRVRDEYRLRAEW